MPPVVEALLLPENRRVRVELAKGTVRELLHRLGLSVEDAVVLNSEGKPLLDDEVLRDGERVRVLRAASGG
ncbi:MAG: MoaD/ThiS family protein [Crenarchaeota archaeon]|nr:MoaD/ThiS family protein [Thermoproteota archaeon]